MRHQKKRYTIPRSKYAKIPLKTKLRFLKKIITQGFSIRDSATIYDINYSTAKTLMRQYRSDSFQFDLNQPIDQQLPTWDGSKKRVRSGYRSVQNQSEVKPEGTYSCDNFGGLNLAENGGSSCSFCSNSAKIETQAKQLKVTSFKPIEIISSISFE